jgi:hypothetical protein
MPVPDLREVATVLTALGVGAKGIAELIRVLRTDLRQRREDHTTRDRG